MEELGMATPLLLIIAVTVTVILFNKRGKMGVDKLTNLNDRRVGSQKPESDGPNSTR